jgi:hypothetical protein
MNQSIGYAAFTIQADGIVRQLVTDAYVKPIYSTENQNSDPVKFRALWDTGATNSVITDQVVKMCDLQPIGMRQVSSTAGIDTRPYFVVSIGLRENLWFDHAHVTLAKMESEFDT